MDATSPTAQPERRSFLQWLSYALLTVAALLVALPFIGFLFGRRKQAVVWVPLGPVSDFPLGETRLTTFQQRLQNLGHWFDARLSFRASIWPMATHPVPKELAGPMGWWYVFGSASLTMLMIQILTGVGLALVYVPSADQAYESLLYLNYEQP